MACWLRIFSFVLAGFLGLAFVARSEEPAGAATALDGSDLYTTRTCVACHGKDANTPLLPSYPKLAGQNAEYLLQQMKDIKSGARTNGQSPAMRGIMHLVNESEMVVLAGYLSKLNPQKGK